MKYLVKEHLLDILPVIFVSSFVSGVIYTFSFLDIHFILIFDLQLLTALVLSILFNNILRFKEYLSLQNKISVRIKNLFLCPIKIKQK